MDIQYQSLDSLKKAYTSCKKCPLLVDCRSQIVFGNGNPQSKILFIGEAPGAVEDAKGIPFQGRSGQLLDSLLTEIGLTREDVYITNTILCRPPRNRNPSKQELLNCKNRLNNQIAILNPKIIVPLGNFATKYILETKEGITTLKGKVHTKKIFGKERTILPMLHPAVLVYNGNSPKKRKEFMEDFITLKKLLD